jgi:hypothetical protein
LRLPLQPAVQSFFKLRLSLWVSLGMPGAWHQFAPAMTIEQAINRAVIHSVSKTGLKGSPDLCRRRDLVGLSPGKKRSEELSLFFSREILMPTASLAWRF